MTRRFQFDISAISLGKVLCLAVMLLFAAREALREPTRSKSDVAVEPPRVATAASHARNKASSETKSASRKAKSAASTPNAAPHLAKAAQRTPLDRKPQIANTVRHATPTQPADTRQRAMPPLPWRIILESPAKVPAHSVPAKTPSNLAASTWPSPPVPRSDPTPPVPPPPPSLSPTQPVEEKAAEYVARGMRLAERGATMAARAEFRLALTHLAESYDQQTFSHSYTGALSAANLALKEAHDFLGGVAHEVDVGLLAEGHRCRALTRKEAESLSPTEVRERYLTFAQQRLVAAVGTSPAGSQALFAIGKMEMMAAGKSAGLDRKHTPAAMIYLQSALLADPNHALAANELGIVLGRSGQWSAAAAAFQHSLRVNPQPETWLNLAAIHDRLGETDLASKARAEFQTLMQERQRHAPPHKIGSQIEWLEPYAFAATGTTEAPQGRGGAPLR